MSQGNTRSPNLPPPSPRAFCPPKNTKVLVAAGRNASKARALLTSPQLHLRGVAVFRRKLHEQRENLHFSSPPAPGVYVPSVEPLNKFRAAEVSSEGGPELFSLRCAPRREYDECARRVSEESLRATSPSSHFSFFFFLPISLFFLFCPSFHFKTNERSPSRGLGQQRASCCGDGGILWTSAAGAKVSIILSLPSGAPSRASGKQTKKI